MLAVGDILHAIANPGSGAQASAEFGFALDLDGDQFVVGAPSADANGFPNTGEAYLLDATTGLVDVTLANPTPAPGDRFGHAVAISATHVAVGDFRDDNGATDAGSVFIFQRDTGELLREIPNPTPHAFDFFGSALALQADTLIVGAYLDDTSGEDSGATYVFDVESGELIHTLFRPDGEAFDYFGYSVDVSGDHIVASAHRANVGAIDDGEVIVFKRDDASLDFRFANPTPENFEYFGRSVSMDGNRILVGAYRDDEGAVNSGTAYLINRTTRELEHTLANPAPSVGANFGFSTDLFGDQAIVGAYRSDTDLRDVGSAFVFDASDGELIKTLKNPDPGPVDYFGASVSIWEGGAAAGAYWDDTLARDSGSVYLFDLTTDERLTAFGPASSSFDYFGHDVAITDDALVVGTYLEDTGAADAGVVHVYDPRTGLLQRTIENPTPKPFDRFGVSVSLSDNRVVVGASGATIDGVARAGAAYVFDVRSGQLLHTLTSPNPSSHGSFGASVSVWGEQIAIGAYAEDDSNVVDSGMVYVFDTVSGALMHEIANPFPDAFDQFGFSVSIAHDMVAVGAHTDDTHGEDAGSAYVFDSTTGELVSRLVNPWPEELDHFGHAVSLSDGNVLVGAPRKNAGAKNAGAAFLLEAATGNVIGELRQPRPETDGFFGHDVALSTEYAMIGAYAAAGGAPLTGAAFLFDARTTLFHSELYTEAPYLTDYLGFSVDASESYLTAGAPLADGTSTDRGAAFVFDGGLPLDPPPVARVGGPYVGIEGSTLTLDGTNSFDIGAPESSLVFEWDLNFDGADFDVDLTGSTVGIVFDDDRPESIVALRVTDGKNQQSIDATSLRIENQPPSLSADVEQIAAEFGDAVFASGTVSDPGNDSIELQASLGEIVDNEDGTWDWRLGTDESLEALLEVLITATDDDGGRAAVTLELELGGAETDATQETAPPPETERPPETESPPETDPTQEADPPPETDPTPETAPPPETDRSPETAPATASGALSVNEQRNSTRLVRFGGIGPAKEHQVQDTTLG